MLNLERIYPDFNDGTPIFRHIRSIRMVLPSLYVMAIDPGILETKTDANLSNGPRTINKRSNAVVGV